MSTNVLIVPGYHGSGDAHWQSWLQTQLPQARRVTGIDWEKPALHPWADAVINDLDKHPDPSIIVAHSFGCLVSRGRGILDSPESPALPGFCPQPL